MTKREKDIEKSEQEEEELELIIQENVGHEENMWPGMNFEDTSLINLTCFFVNLIILPTGFTFFLERAESHDGLICRHWIREHAKRLLQTIDQATAKMGSVRVNKTLRGPL